MAVFRNPDDATFSSPYATSPSTLRVTPNSNGNPVHESIEEEDTTNIQQPTDQELVNPILRDSSSRASDASPVDSWQHREYPVRQELYLSSPHHPYSQIGYSTAPLIRTLRETEEQPRQPLDTAVHSFDSIHRLINSRDGDDTLFSPTGPRTVNFNPYPETLNPSGQTTTRQAPASNTIPAPIGLSSVELSPVLPSGRFFSSPRSIVNPTPPTPHQETLARPNRRAPDEFFVSVRGRSSQRPDRRIEISSLNHIANTSEEASSWFLRATRNRTLSPPAGLSISSCEWFGCPRLPNQNPAQRRRTPSLTHEILQHRRLPSLTQQNGPPSDTWSTEANPSEPQHLIAFSQGGPNTGYGNGYKFGHEAAHLAYPETSLEYRNFYPAWHQGSYLDPLDDHESSQRRTYRSSAPSPSPVREFGPPYKPQLLPSPEIFSNQFETHQTPQLPYPHPEALGSSFTPPAATPASPEYPEPNELALSDTTAPLIPDTTDRLQGRRGSEQPPIVINPIWPPKTSGPGSRSDNQPNRPAPPDNGGQARQINHFRPW